MNRGPQPRPAEERFWPKVIKTDGCWVWTAGLDDHGYGSFNVGSNRKMKAHVFAYTALVGPVPNGLILDHLCRNTRCVNPAHLEPVTHRENVLRGISPAARAAASTHCPRGHEYTPENTYRFPKGGHRRCRTCHREDSNRRYHAARLAQHHAA